MIRQTARLLSNNMLILSEADVRRCVPVSAAIAANRKALASLRQAEDGGAMVPSRIGLPYYPPSTTATAGESTSSSSPADWSLFKPAAYYPPESQHAEDTDILMGMKLISLRANNPSKYNKPLASATTMLVDADTGEVSAIVAATYLTAARTAAGSALATEMAFCNRNTTTKDDGLTMVVFGAGLQAELHIKSIQHVVNITKLIIVNRSSGRAEKLREALSCTEQQYDQESKTQSSIGDISITLLSDKQGIEDAVKVADVIATTTNTCTPLFDGKWLKPGCHINGIGSYTPLMQEIDNATVKRSEVLIDTKEALDVGDLVCLKQDKEVNVTTKPNNLIGMIGDALVGNIEMGSLRDDPERKDVDCTFFKSVGTAIQDVVSANIAVEIATKNNVGVNVDM